MHGFIPSGPPPLSVAIPIPHANSSDMPVKIVLLCIMSKAKIYSSIVFLLLLACQSSDPTSDTPSEAPILQIEYNDPEVDIVQFKMFQGLHLNLPKDSIDGVFRAAVPLDHLDEAIFSYDMLIYKKDSTGKLEDKELIKEHLLLNQQAPHSSGKQLIWVGKNRQHYQEKNDSLIGRLETISMSSKFLDAPRKITSYYPKNSSKNIPLMYMTDGSAVQYYAPYVDYLIQSGQIQPIQLIGIHSSRDERYQEYVYGSNDMDIFEKHEQFVFEEVLPKTESDIPNWEGARYFYGFSNGGAFCMYAGIEHPTLFEEIIAFSTADYISPMAQSSHSARFEADAYPAFYMGSGIHEGRIHTDNIYFVDILKKHHQKVDYRNFTSGHDHHVWRIEFLDYLVKRFSKQ